MAALPFPASAQDPTDAINALLQGGTSAQQQRPPELGILVELTKSLAERTQSTETDVHVSDERVVEASEGCGQPATRRNGSSQKTMTADSGKVVLDFPRDQNGTFDPMLIAEY